MTTQHGSRIARHGLLLALLAILALGAILRFHNLSGQSLWNDEGTSVALAARSLSQITRDAAADIHPPLYHYLLHYWLLVFGNSEAGARSLSALVGVGLVALTYLLGRRLFSPLTGLIAALLAAVSPYLIYYSQEARMYMLLTLLGAASSYLFYLAWVEVGSRSRQWAALGWVLATALALYTHYLAVTVVLAQNVVWAANLPGVWRRRQDREAKPLAWAAGWVAAQAVVALLYLPWLRLTWAQLNRWPAVSEPFGLLTLLRRALPLFAVGPLVPAGSFRWLVVAVLGLALAGLFWPVDEGERGRSGRLLALLHWLAPVAVLYYLSRSRPVYHPKFLVVAVPGFLLLVAHGVARLAPALGRPLHRLGWARLGLAACAGVVAISASLPGLHNGYNDPRYARDDYRGIARYIAALGRPGDAVLINAPSQIETVAYYYPGPLPLVPLPRQRPPDRQATIDELASLARGAQRFFCIFWATNESDPERIVEGWLDSHAYKALDAWYGNVRLVIYALPSTEAGNEIQHPLRVDLGGQVRLDGYALVSEEVEAGDIVQLSLFWQATNVIQRRYKVFTHLLDGGGHLVGQRDAEPVGGQRFTNTWREGERIVDRYGIPVPAGTPPGEYLLEVGMYNPDDGLRLPIVEGGKAVGDHIILQTVRVVRPRVQPPVEALDMQHHRLLKGEQLQLLGYSFGRLGAAPQTQVTLRPNDVAELVLFWQAPEAPRQDVEVQLRVVDSAGRTQLAQSTLPVGGRYPLRDWQPGEIVRDIIHLRLPGDLAPGRYRLLIRWRGGLPSGDMGQPGELLRFVVQ